MRIKRLAISGLVLLALGGFHLDAQTVVSERVSSCLNLRSGPSAESVPVGCLPSLSPVEVVSPGSDWTEVRAADGTSGWVSTGFLAAAPSAPSRADRQSESTSSLQVEAQMQIGSRTLLGVALYDQTDSAAGAGFASQNFAAVDDAFDCRAADDFTVPIEDIQWNVDAVQVLGAYFNGTGPAPLLDLEIFDDAGGAPAGTSACSFSGLVAGVDFIDDGLGNFDIMLPMTCELTAGTYWLSVRVDMDQATGGQWLWGERSAQNGALFAWENPGDGFGTGCVTWTAGTSCSATAPDLLFALLGEVVPVELQSFEID